MAWSYNQISVDTAEEVLSAIETHAVACGWVVDRSSNGELCLHSTGENGVETLFFSMKVSNESSGKKFILMKGNTSYDSGATWDNQPGKTVYNIGIYVLTSGNGYVDCYGDKDTIYAAVHVTGGYVQFLGFGRTQRVLSTQTEQQFIFGSNRTSATTYPSGSYTATETVFYNFTNQCLFRYDSAWRVDSGTNGVSGLYFNYSQPNQYEFFDIGNAYLVKPTTGQTSPLSNPVKILLPIYLISYIYAPATYPLFNQLAGIFKNIYFTSFSGVSVLGEELTYGSSVFKMYPSRGFSENYYGIAIRKA